MQERWDICQSYLKEKGANDQSIKSFDAFIDRELRQCIYELFQIDVKVGVDLKRPFKVQCTNVVIQNPVNILATQSCEVAVPACLHWQLVDDHMLASDLALRMEKECVSYPHIAAGCCRPNQEHLARLLSTASSTWMIGAANSLVSHKLAKRHVKQSRAPPRPRNVVLVPSALLKAVMTKSSA